LADAPSATPAASDAVLTAEHLAQLTSLEARARLVADGLLVGHHRSRRFGSSSEFAEHKVYAPGDDLRRMDWKTYARKNRYYVRRYEEETHLSAFLVVDASHSMAYAGGAKGKFTASKFDAARIAIAGVAWALQHKSDAAGLSLLYDDGVHKELPPSARQDQLRQLLHELDQAKPKGTTVLQQQLQRAVERVRKKSLVVVCSDFLDVGDDILQPLAVLRRRGCDVVVLHLMHRDEVEFPFEGVVLFEDLEGDREVQVDAGGVKKAYLDEMQKHCDHLQQQCEAFDLRYHRMLSDEDLVAHLRQALAMAPSGQRLLHEGGT